MSASAITLSSAREGMLSRVRDYVELTKPKIAVLVLLVVIASGTVASWSQPDPLSLLHAVIGTLLVAGSASAANQWIERSRDARMQRTANRPLPAGRLSPAEVAGFSAGCLITGVLYLALTTNWPTTAWLVISWILYVAVYTPLKPISAVNTAVGAVAGALPALIGWSATGAPLYQRALALFLLIFLWQFPHFMAIAWLYRQDYSRAGHQMLPVVDPSGRRAGVQAVLAALVLIPVSAVPALHDPGLGGVAYVAVAALLGLAQLAISGWFLVRMNDASARLLLRASLVYLPVLMTLLMLIPFIK